MGFYKIVLLFCLIVTLATRFPEAETRAISEEESLSKCYLLCLIMFCSFPFYTCNCCIKIFRKQNPRSKKIGLRGNQWNSHAFYFFNWDYETTTNSIQINR